jgi:GNAT superfamily N-acetyltransferase
MMISSENTTDSAEERIIPLEPDDEASFQALYDIYCEAIPANERKKEPELRKLTARNDYVFYLLEQNRQVTGFAILYRSSVTGVSLLEYMAVDKRYRNGGAGSRIVARLFAEEVSAKGCPACLVEVDAPGSRHADSEIRQRRQNFYRRNGCLLVEGFSYILPLPTDGTPADMELMAWFPPGRERPDRTRFGEWLRDVYVHVYGCVPEDPRLATMMERLPVNPVFI